MRSHRTWQSTVASESQTTTMPSKTSFDILHALPLELLGHVFKQLDFHSIGPLLTAFPEFKQYTLIVGRYDLPERDRFFKIDGVTTLTSFPYRMREHPLLKNRNILLVLCDINANDYSHYHETRETEDVMGSDEFKIVKTFTLPISERIFKYKGAVFVHLLYPCTSYASYKHHSMREELVIRGIPLLERFGTSEALEVASLPLVWQKARVAPLSSVDYEEEGTSVIIRGHDYVEDINFWDTEKLVIEFPPPLPNTTQVLSHIIAPCLRELHIRYHTVPPRIERLDFSPDVPMTSRLLCLVDLDSEAWNVDQLRTTEEDLECARDRVLNFIDWSFVIDFQHLHISGSMTRLILHSSDLTKVVTMHLVETGEQPMMEQPILQTPLLKHLAFRTRITVCTVPLFTLNNLYYLCLSSTGKEFYFSDLLRRTQELIGLSISVLPTIFRVNVVLSELLEYSVNTLRYIGINSVPSPFLEDDTLQFNSLRDANLARLLQVRPSKTLRIEAFQYSNLRTLRLWQHRGAMHPWSSISVNWAPCVLDTSLHLWIEGFDGSLSFGPLGTLVPSMSSGRPFRFGELSLQAVDGDVAPWFRLFEAKDI